MCIRDRVEPSYHELKDAGIHLTDMQLLHIYDFVQTGVNTLKLFREKQRANQDHESGTGAEGKRQQSVKTVSYTHLERYLKPGVTKPWSWRKVYPNSNQIVDYNTQRLARTSVTHAYQISFQRSTRNNPFIEKYQWHSSNSGRVCPLCLSRDGQLYEKDDVPLDHPNGMCIITAVISKSYEQIADELADWARGGKNPALDLSLIHIFPS